MDSTFKDFLASGKGLLSDTKRPGTYTPSKKEKAKKAQLMPLGQGTGEQDPHKIMIRRVIKEKPSKKEVVEQFQRFIDSAENAL